ncbi:MAG: dCTP deaminase [Candidatus Aminicenantia bacterium]
MIKSDRWIKEMAIEHKMIEPFSEKLISKGIISFGLSSYGYDIRISDEFKIPKNSTFLIDPKNISEEEWEYFKGDSVIIEPNSYLLGRSVEYFRMPRRVSGICLGKSTYARCGIVVNVTPLEPEWEGYLTISIANTGRQKVKIYANEGIAQIIFVESDEDCEISYKERKGKYQAQKEIVLPKVAK